MVRPRTTCPPDEELDALGQEMLEWIENNDCVHVSDWYCIEKMIDDNTWDQMIEKDVFRPYYKKAIKLVGRKYLKEDTGIEPRIKDRWIRLYYKDLKKQEDTDKDEDIKRQKTLAETVAPEQMAQIQAFMSLLDSARNNAINNTKSE